MGRAKAEMMRLEGVKGFATAAAMKAGAVEACEIHDDIIMDCFDPEAESRAYEVALEMMGADALDGSHEELREAIREVIEESSDGCPYCAKNMAG